MPSEHVDKNTYCTMNKLEEYLKEDIKQDCSINEVYVIFRVKDWIVSH